MEKDNGKFKVGIAGYGVVGKRRQQFIDRHPKLKTIAVCDQKFDGSGIFSDGIKYFKNHQELLKESLDILFVCLPNYMASEATIAGLKHGLHVFCEKPPGRNMEDIKKVVEIKKKYPSLFLKYGFNHRYHDSVREALRIIKSGELGEIINLRGVYGKGKMTPFDGNWRSERKYAGGGILLDQGIHMVDLMRLFCGDFIKVKSFVSNNFWKHDVEDNAYALMRDAKGRVAILHSSATQWQHRFSLEVAMADGYIELQGILSGTKSYGEEKLIIGRRNNSATGAEKEETITYLDDNSWRDEINEFADAIVKNSPILSGTLEDAYKAMELVYHIYRSDQEWCENYNL